MFRAITSIPRVHTSRHTATLKSRRTMPAVHYIRERHYSPCCHYYAIRQRVANASNHAEPAPSAARVTRVSALCALCRARSGARTRCVQRVRCPRRASAARSDLFPPFRYMSRARQRVRSSARHARRLSMRLRALTRYARATRVMTEVLCERAMSEVHVCPFPPAPPSILRHTVQSDATNAR